MEDNVDAAESLAAYLRLGGYEVHVAFDGPGAIEAATAYQPEVVLLDIGQTIRAKKRGSDAVPDGRRLERPLSQQVQADSLPIS